MLRRVRIMKALAMIAMIVALAAPARAQETQASGSQGHITVGGVLVRQQGDTYLAGGPFTPREGPSGVAAGLTFGGAIFVTPHVSLGAEIAFPRRVSHHQQTGTLEVLTEHRDVMAGGVLRVHTRPSARWEPELLIGAGLARADTRRALWRLAPQRVGPFEDERRRTSMAWTFGADLRMTVSRHVSLAPGFRADRIGRDPDDDFAGFLGLGRWVLRSHLQVRVCLGPNRRPSSPAI